MEFPGCPAAAGVAMGDEAEQAEKEGHAQVLFDEFVQASTCRTTLRAFNLLCEHLQLTHTHTQPQTYSATQPQRPFYHTLKERLSYWKANALWAKLDKRAAHHEYGKGRVCANTTCVIIGAGPCGLRTAVELGFLGARVVLLEKRDAFSRNNVLHLWPFTIHDLRGLGAKKFYGKFCAGAIDHISIRQLQLVLLKVALLLGVEVHVNVEFKGLVEPPADQEQQKVGWRVEVKPKSHPINQLQCDVVIGADGRRNTLPGFRRKEFRGKLAIAITANFMNRNTTAEAKVEEISGVAFIFNQRFFQELRDATGVDLENIVYYKDDTHYFVMTAKKQSLLEKGVILRDYADTETLLSRGNVDQNALLAYAREAADFSTNHQLPSLDFAMNHYGQPDVALFDFTCMYASENAALVRQRHGHHLLVTLVGDSLLEPFWPMGTGIARGFLAALDSAWMVRSWAQGLAPLDILAERESLYRLLPQASPENVNKNFGQYTVDPATRYPNINPQLITPAQVGHLIYTEESGGSGADQEPRPRSPLPKLLRQESFSRSSKLLSWCQQQTQGYRGVAVSDLTTSWKSGLALCALIHHYRPDLIDVDSLKEDEGEENMRLGLEVAEKEFGISPVMTVEEMSSVSETDTLCMVMYLSQFHQLFKDALPPSESQTESPDGRAAVIGPASLLSRLGHSPSRKRNPKEQKEKDAVGKRRKTSRPCLEDVRQDLRLVDSYEEEAAVCSVGGASQSRVRSMANQLLAKFEENAPCPSSTPAAVLRRQKYVQMYTGGVSSLAEQISCQLQSQESPSPQHTPDRKESAGVHSVLAGPGPGGASDVCFFCSKRVYVMERLSAEGLFFHRSCFQCDHCSSTLRLASYAYDRPNGKFYCKPHYDLRLVGPVQRKRPAPPTSDQHPAPYERTPSQRTLLESQAALSTNPRSSVTVMTADRRSSVASLIERECGLAKRVRGTPERIELENYRGSLGSLETEQLTDEPEEVPEETLANYNLSLLVTEEKKANHKRSSLWDNEGSSSESETEEEGERQRALTNDLARDSWRKAMELHARLRGERGDDEEETEEGEEEGEVDEDDDDDELSSDGEGASPLTAEEVASLDEWQQSTHSPDTHSPDTYSPDTHFPDTHTPATHTPDTHSPDTHTTDIQLPDSTTPDTHGPFSPTSVPNITFSTPATASTPFTPLTSHAPTPTSSVSIPDSSVFTYSSPNSSTTSGCSPGPDEGEEDGEKKEMKERKEREERERGGKERERVRDSSSSSGIGVGGSSTTSTSDPLTPPGIPPPAQLKACWDSLPHPAVEAESLQSPTSRSAPRFAPAPIMVSAVVGVRGKKLKPWDMDGGRGSVAGGSVGAGSLGEQLCKGVVIDPLEDINPPLSPLKPLKAVPRDEREIGRKREMERRREIERAAMGVGWEDTKIPLGREPLPGKSRGGLDPRRLAESLPPLLLTQLQGGSLFPSRKCRRDNQPPSQSVSEAGIGEGGPLGLWRAVFSGYKKDRKKKGRTSLPIMTTAPAPKEQGRRKTSAERRGVKFRERQSWSEPEESDITCSVVMERCSMNPKANLRLELFDLTSDLQKETIEEEEEEENEEGERHVGKERERDSSPHIDTQRKSSCPTEVVGVLVHMKDLKDPSSLDVSEAMFHRERDPEEEQLDARLTRRVQRAARKQAKQEQLKRLHRAQMIQRQLEQVEEKQRQLEERGVAVEKALRGEADYWGESNDSEELDLHLGVMGRQDDPALMQQWFKLVQQKNCLMRYESELMIFARELELEDRQSRLQQELRERMAVDDHLKGEAELAEEKLILGEMLEVVEQRDALVSLLEEQRLQESQEDRDLEAIMLSRGLGLHNWA
ncbi:protein-methionine sulfoxide oxidase mical3b-like isoform X1 [Salvelinus fontinalis]|uniref:protein-methionine sulfoxide oxidase mical3b-like isoform X1 n=1 Tax=Salvelinus fontinalis TaxID=8038 RepID=UPI002484E950|nr:protein-methionine sulfoxide oxidase mical3b-like isoform X1 [Salvelinus fontinalis]